ncbi:MAG: HNH endonuclease signature motif containing protein [Promethearchaeota archaeon]
MVTRIKWKPEIKKLSKLALNLYKDSALTYETYIKGLTEIFPESSLVKNTDTRSIAFLEFCFFMADGPYSRKFKFFILVLRKIFRIDPNLKRLISKTGSRAIANMALGAKGNLVFQISDQYELEIVLWAWKKMGLKIETIRSVYNAIIRKKNVKRGIQEQRLFLLARLRSIFPMYKRSFIKTKTNLNQALYEHYRARFDIIIKSYEKKGYSISEMLQEENKRILPVGVKRNNLLAYLVKKAKDFQCQLCSHLQFTPTRSYEIQVHHITPLSQGGGDTSHNMIVLCEKHHDEAHQGRLTLFCSDKYIIAKYKGKQIQLAFN